MSPSAKRHLNRWAAMFLLVLAASIVLQLAPNSTAIWTLVILCAASAVVLFHLRERFRTAFLMPMVLAPFALAAHFGPESEAGELAIGMFGLTAFGAFLTDAFWKPYETDLEQLEYERRFRD